MDWPELREALTILLGEQVDKLLTQMGCTEYCINKERKALDIIEAIVEETLKLVESRLKGE